MVDAEDKRAARSNCIAHLLGQVPYCRVDEERLRLPTRVRDDGGARPPRDHYPSVLDVTGTPGD